MYIFIFIYIYIYIYIHKRKHTRKILCDVETVCNVEYVKHNCSATIVSISHKYIYVYIHI